MLQGLIDRLTIAGALRETTETVRRRPHQVRMAVREPMTGYFAVTTGRHRGGS